MLTYRGFACGCARGDARPVVSFSRGQVRVSAHGVSSAKSCFITINGRRATPSRIVLVRDGLHTGFISIDLRRHRFRTVACGIGEKGGVGVLEVPIRLDSGRYLSNTITRCNLQRFRPQARWYEEAAAKYKEPRPGWIADWESSSILIAWSSKKRAFVVPPLSMLPFFPEEGRQQYNSLCALVKAVNRIEERLLATSAVRPAGLADRKEMTRIDTIAGGMAEPRFGTGKRERDKKERKPGTTKPGTAPVYY
jgi:hypothetical protein